MILKNKICLLTGATGGLGIELIKQLIVNNIKIILVGKNKKKLSSLKKQYKKNVLGTFACDFSDQKNISKTLNALSREKFKIDILINCAGNFIVKDFNKVTNKEIIADININLIAPMLFSKVFLQHMKRKNWGRIINIGSSSSYAGFSKTVTYCSAKHGLLGLSRSLNEEFKQYGIRTYIFSTGTIKTRMGKKVKNQTYKNFIDPAELSSFIINTIKQNDNMITEEIKINRISYK